MQLLQHDGGRYFDVLLLELTSGEIRRVYFDVTELFTAGREYLQRRAAESEEQPTDDDQGDDGSQ
jgi:hypothetical protein